MIYAEKRYEDGGDGYYTLRYIVWNDDMAGTYGVHISPRSGAYSASRDYHRKLADGEQVAANECFNLCEYHGHAESGCDGSSLVERITDNDKRCFEIAAMMAGI